MKNEISLARILLATACPGSPALWAGSFTIVKRNSLLCKILEMPELDTHPHRIQWICDGLEKENRVGNEGGCRYSHSPSINDASIQLISRTLFEKDMDVI
jgi:hypothetical protein